MVAIKKMYNLFRDIYSAKKELSEINILRKLSSVKQNVFTTVVYDLVIPEVNYEDESPIKNIFIVMEILDTDMNDLIADSDRLMIDEEHITILMYNILCSLNFIHTSNIVHRDIKPSNLLVDKNCGIKICDFGLARSLPKAKFNMEKYV